MKNILILYPSQFNCESKFNRKLSKIVGQITDYSILCPNDKNNLVVNFFGKINNNIDVIIKEEWDVNNITHAVIFDDGEEFKEEINTIKTNKINYRLIKIKITRVVNIKRDIKFNNKKSTSEYEYIGRGALWGNPYSMYEKGDDRDEVIRKYKYDFDHNMFINKDKKDVYKLLGKRLGCFCKPAKCHGDILADYLNKYDDGR